MPILRAGAEGGRGAGTVDPGEGGAAGKAYAGLPEPLRRPEGRRWLTADRDWALGIMPDTFPCSKPRSASQEVLCSEFAILEDC